MSNLKEYLKHGGPAFPTENDEVYWHGMTLRDYFAIQIFKSLIVVGSSNKTIGSLTDDAVKFADVLMEKLHQ